MPVLAKSKYERFATEIALGSNYYQAYTKAGYTAKSNSASASAAKLLENPIISARIAELSAEITQKSIMSQVEVLQELTKLGRANMQDFMRIGIDGQPVLDWSNLSREQAAAIQEVTVEEFVDGRSDKREVRRVKFKLAPKTNALELLGKHHGSFVERVEVKHQHTVLHTLLKEIDAESREIVAIEDQSGAGQQEDDVL